MKNSLMFITYHIDVAWMSHSCCFNVTCHIDVTLLNHCKIRPIYSILLNLQSFKTFFQLFYLILNHFHLSLFFLWHKPQAHLHAVFITNSTFSFTSFALSPPHQPLMLSIYLSLSPCLPTFLSFIGFHCISSHLSTHTCLVTEVTLHWHYFQHSTIHTHRG